MRYRDFEESLASCDAQAPPGRTGEEGSVSERLERLARMTALAEKVWEDPKLAHEFLTSPQP
jgi:uncharacterized protein (DUF2384 family)